MKNKIKKYICVLFCVFAAVCGILSSLAYAVDPQNVYRWNENGLRYFSPKYSTASSIRTYDYDLAVIGSSMVQNFDADALAEGMDCKPLKLTIGAMTPDEILWVYGCVNEQEKANTFIINIDLHRFAGQETGIDCGRFTEHTYEPCGVSQFRYLLGYETWFRFIPLDIALTLCRKTGIALPASLENLIATATDINRMCEFDNTKPIGEEEMYRIFIENKGGFDEGTDLFSNLANGSKNMGFFLKELEKQLALQEKLILVLPPYSMLYWAKLSEQEMDTLLAMREQLAQFAEEHENVFLMDFQAEEYTKNLNRYIDSNHYSVETETEIIRDIMNYSATHSGADEVLKNSVQIRENTAYALEQIKLRQQS